MRNHLRLLMPLVVPCLVSGMLASTACAPVDAAPAAAGKAAAQANRSAADANPAGTYAYTTARTGGLHDFDFIAGAWTLENRRLKQRWVAEKDRQWDEFPAEDCGTVYLGGVANSDELRFPTKGWSGVTFRNFDAEKRQWTIHWVNSRTGKVDPGVVGGFDGDRGEFYGEDQDDGRPVKVRYLWIKHGPDRAHWEQAFSLDGKTWEVNWINELTRVDPAKLCDGGHLRDLHNESTAPAQPSGGTHDFDFEFGKWRVHHRVKRDGQWTDFEGTCTDRGLVDGSANVEEHTFFRKPGTGHGIAVRAYDAKTMQWAIWWIDGRDPHGALDPPVKGRFTDGVGTFYSDSVVDGKTVRTRLLWSHITAKSARWEQAMSSDLGKTWDTNWVMEFSRIE